MEKLIHGKPSGCDVEITLKGGCIKFTKSDDGQYQVERFDKVFKTNFILVNTNKQRSAKQMIDKVIKLKEDDPEKFEETMGTIGDVTDELIECLQEENVDQFQLLDLVSMNQQYL